MAAEAKHQATEILGRSYPMLLPAGLFVMQQVLVIIAATHLDAVTFQICSQSFKIMPTALFAVWLLDQHLSPIQWASLPVLAIGVVFVTMNTSNSAVPANRTSELDLLLGLAASALSGLSSAYAGVYFEKYVKGKMGQTLWIRNLQLSIYGVPLSIVYTIIKDGSAIRAGGFHQGFNSLVWFVVALQVFGGLIVGMVVKYADNIQKNFANALSVIFTVLGAMPLFGQIPSAWFIVGVTCTMTSVFMYQKSAPVAFDSFSRAWKQSRRRAGAAAELCCVRLGLAKREGKTTSLLRAGQIAAVVLVVLLLVSVGVGLVATAHPPTQRALHRHWDRAFGSGPLIRRWRSRDAVQHPHGQMQQGLSNLVTRR